ncbi:hypothetical protein CGRA01v4_08976 [Colletotrichum graminicola]|nr:hypothetical protein CGRA01v4_08976 [Colletotrichum graminicola]
MPSWAAGARLSPSAVMVMDVTVSVMFRGCTARGAVTFWRGPLGGLCLRFCLDSASSGVSGTLPSARANQPYLSPFPLGVVLFAPAASAIRSPVVQGTEI